MSDDQARSEQLPGLPISIWMDTTPETSYPTLDGPTEVDVVIVGGGIAGLTAAMLLKEAGRTVAVLEARRIVQNVTGNTTAKVTSQHGLRYARMLRSFGEENTRAYARANQMAVTDILEMARRYGIDCDFTGADAYLFTHDADEVQSLRDEADAAITVGLPARFTTEVPLPYPVEGAVVFDNQARFHPRKFLLGLAERIPGDGSHIFEQTRVLDVTDGEPCIVETEWGTVRARDVIVASHYPFGDRSLYTLRLKPKRSLVLGVITDNPIPAALSRSMLISTDPMHSLRTQSWRDQEMLFIGGEIHKTGQAEETADLYQRLATWARAHFGPLHIVYRWATQDNVTPDDVPYTGRLYPGSEHVYVTTGYGGWGMTNSMASAKLLRDLVTGADNPAQAVYDPARLKFDGLGQIVREGADAVKHLVADRFRSVNPADIAPGSGGVIKDGIKPVAVYRDASGTEHRMSAVCTHLGCIVNWNDTEKSWDCPCHGSRFGARGDVLQTPAFERLAAVDEDTPDR